MYILITKGGKRVIIKKNTYEEIIDEGVVQPSEKGLNKSRSPQKPIERRLPEH